MRIVIGYNGHIAALNALALAKEHARVFDGKIYVLESLEGGHDDTKKHLKKIRESTDNLEFAKNFFKSDGIKCETHLLIRGLSPGKDLVKFADDIKADEIVIGVENKSKVGKFLLGSTAQYVTLHANCPVATVK